MEIFSTCSVVSTLVTTPVIAYRPIAINLRLVGLGYLSKTRPALCLGWISLTTTRSPSYFIPCWVQRFIRFLRKLGAKYMFFGRCPYLLSCLCLKFGIPWLRIGVPSQTPLFFPSAGVLYPIVFVARILFASCNLFFFTVSIPFLRLGRAKRIYQLVKTWVWLGDLMYDMRMFTLDRVEKIMVCGLSWRVRMAIPHKGWLYQNSTASSWLSTSACCNSSWHKWEGEFMSGLIPYVDSESSEGFLLCLCFSSRKTWIREGAPVTSTIIS